MQAGLFHGGEPLCETQVIGEVASTTSDGNFIFDKTLVFDIEVCNIPRMTRLCLSVYEMSKIPKGPKHRKSKITKQVSV